MKRSITAATIMAFAVLAGCNRGTPGGPGTTESATNKHFYDASPEDTFTLSVPSSMPLMSTSLKLGGTTKVVIGINRKKNFAQDVALKLEGLPTGVTVDQDAAEIKHDQTEATLTLTASESAALGDFEIKVVGHPAKGGDATNKFKIVVEKKETFTVSVPTFSTSLKQGEEKSVAISINREKNFDEDVTLKFADLPKGVTLEPAVPVIKHGETEAKLMLKCESDAALGDFGIKVTGHPVKGADASHNLKITVAKK
jgi:uncharacterized membrane protein